MSGIVRLLALLGPGIIASTSGDDAGTITTASVIGAQLGYNLLWLAVLLTIVLAFVQELAARLGVVTGRGLLALVRERFGAGWTIFSVVVILVANTGTTITEYVGVSAAADLFHVSQYILVPLAAAGVWLLILYGRYRHAEKLFLAMSLAFLAYPLTVLVTHPDWLSVFRGTVVPHMPETPGQWLLVIAAVGAVVTPYQQLFQQSAVVEKKVPRKYFPAERTDAILGAVLGNLVWISIIIATGATLHSAGDSTIQTASDVAQALSPLAGDFAAALFGVGLLGASLLAASVVPLTTAYAVSDAFGWRGGVDLDVRQAPLFFGLFSAQVVIGGGVALVPGIPVISLLVGLQVLNGILLPITFAFILLLAGSRKLMGTLVLGRVGKVGGWAIFTLVTAAAIVAGVEQLVT